MAGRAGSIKSENVMTNAIMKTSPTALFVLVFSLILTASTPADDTFRVTSRDHSTDVPNYNVRMFAIAADSAGKARLIVQVVAVHDELQFIKDERRFRADFEITVTIKDTSGQEVNRKSWSGAAFADNFDQTRSEDFISSSGEIVLPPGEYLATIEMLDKETGRAGSIEGRINVRDYFQDQFTASDLIYVTAVDFLKGGAVDTSVTASPQDTAQLYAYFEVYNLPAGDSMQVKYEMKSISGEVVQEGERTIASKGMVTKHYLEIEDKTISRGNFDTIVELRYAGRALTLRQALLPSGRRVGNIYANLEAAIRQLRYIADKKVIEAMLELKGEAQVAAFNEFWKKRDPVKETKENEFFETYYHRVAVANEEFRGHDQGWETQRGMVLIKLGLPDYVSRPLGFEYEGFGNERARIVWHYTYLNRRVIFKYTAGEYRIENYIDVFDLLSGDDIQL